MKIINAQPPNRAAIDKVFPNLSRVIFAYGDVIYNPDNARVDKPMIAHEEVHQVQQDACGIEAWWEAYLRDPQFRLAQEIPAYRRQYQVAKAMMGDKLKPGYAEALAKSLSSATYGDCTTYEEALSFITS